MSTPQNQETLIGARRTKSGIRRPPPFLPTGPLPAPQQGRSLPINQKTPARSLSSYSSSGSSSPALSIVSDSSYEDGGNLSRGRGATRRSTRRKGPYTVSGTSNMATFPVSRRSTHNAIERARRETLAVELSDLARMLPAIEDVKRPSKLVIVQAAIREIKELRDRLSDFHQNSFGASSSLGISTNSRSTRESIHPSPPSLLLPEIDDDAISTITATSSTLATNTSTMSSPSLPEFEDFDFQFSNTSSHNNEYLYQTLMTLPCSSSPYLSSYDGMDWSESMYIKREQEYDQVMKPSADLQSSLLLQPLFDEHHHGSIEHGIASKDHSDLSLFPCHGRMIGEHHDVGGIEDLFMNA